MSESSPILLRCPTCDRIGQESMIRGERFTCGCGSSTFARDPAGYGSAEERRRAAARLSKVAKIDLPSAYSVLLQMMSVRDARRLHDTRIAQLPHVARRRGATAAAAGTRRAQAAADAAKASPDRLAAWRMASAGSAAAAIDAAEPEPAPETPRRLPAEVPRPFAPRRPSPREQKSKRPLDPDTGRWYRDLLIACGVFVAFAITGIAAKQVKQSLTPDGPQRVYVSDRAIVRLDGTGAPVEIRAQDPSYVLRRYCRETGCRPYALAMPSWLPSEARLGLFESDGGVTGAIRIERATLDEWMAGGGTSRIEVYDDPPLPPRTPMVTLSR